MSARTAPPLELGLRPRLIPRDATSVEATPPAPDAFIEAYHAASAAIRGSVSSWGPGESVAHVDWTRDPAMAALSAVGWRELHMRASAAEAKLARIEALLDRVDPPHGMAPACIPTVSVPALRSILRG
ncbi:hypothetical protein SEA_CEN1621_63 [Microbacterium phage Cen1621]|uniref:Uncharacterized protein n=1 Tax=Microbacterium phage Cen1621 TaxID=2965191 RepID=A0A9E7TUS2_9CAUD|nr:hypothetical protein SEA_CEN1621_63 [Microbacterium phage Cen1621]